MVQNTKIETRLVEEQPPPNTQPKNIGREWLVHLTANHGTVVRRPISLGKNPHAL